LVGSAVTAVERLLLNHIAEALSYSHIQLRLLGGLGRSSWQISKPVSADHQRIKP
jgi:hypothetical protein